MIIKQLVGFCIVGVSNFGVSLLVYYICIFWGMHYIAANVISWIIGVFNSFYWNSKYVFSSTGKWRLALLKSYASYGFSFVMGLMLLALLVEWLDVSVIMAPVFVMVIMTPINFIINKIWVFRNEMK